jgi:hypothetical protein
MTTIQIVFIVGLGLFIIYFVTKNGGAGGGA